MGFFSSRVNAQKQMEMIAGSSRLGSLSRAIRQDAIDNNMDITDEFVDYLRNIEAHIEATTMEFAIAYDKSRYMTKSECAKDEILFKNVSDQLFMWLLNNRECVPRIRQSLSVTHFIFQGSDEFFKEIHMGLMLVLAEVERS